ncbi:hypothetical protein HTZ84_20955 [Haloterrigena sp. SYSU A558-1]|uniref:C2H2-type domain-containing protein n=1 Tax=Haloterrigena gelatinilytica TaxID=2741724 RepID=A0ABX2LHW3_9EURY|nr:hypothetical protein [Haloterrigena gelatinilytica]NUC74734.1 hypothetical protein [Haloterrigena gelatinilytica]
MNWDRTNSDHADASDLFHNLHIEDPPEHLGRAEFDQLYREVIDVAVDKPEQVFHEWNRGSGRESDAFLTLRYCERCETYIEGEDEAVTHATQNHGYDALIESGEPDYVRGERSMSVGDIVEINGTYYMAASIGWEAVDIGGG